MSGNYEMLKSLVNAMETDYKKFTDKKVKVSGNRVRNNLLNIKKLCDEIRKDIIIEMDKLPVKHRIMLEKPKLERQNAYIKEDETTP